MDLHSEERLQKILSARGIASRRSAEEMIQAGRVTIDGTPARLGDRANPSQQQICVDGKPINATLEKRSYILLHKPKYVITSVKDEKDRKTVFDVVGAPAVGLWPVGRLDWDSEGLLILTNDGDLTHRLTHPSFGVAKTYEVTVVGQDIPRQAAEIPSIRTLDDLPVQPAQVHVVNAEKITVTIKEGRNRHVRKLCAAVGLDVIRLIRVSEGGLTINGLRAGQWRHLTAEEIARLSAL